MNLPDHMLTHAELRERYRNYHSVFRNLRTVREVSYDQRTPPVHTGWIVWALLVFGLTFFVWHLPDWGL